MKLGIFRNSHICSVFLGLILTACGSSNNNTNSNARPAATPPAVNPSQTAWTQIVDEVASSSIEATGCESPLKFVVKNDGSYVAGPCHQSQNDVATGSLTLDELSKVNSQAATVASEDLSASPQCQPFNSDVTGFVDLTLSAGQTVRILDRSTLESICFRGNQQDVLALGTTLGNLAEKYYPTP